MAAPAPENVEQDVLAHSVYYSTSTCPIKDDTTQLAACWRTGTGPLSKQEVGMLLWYHCQRGEDGRAEVLGAGVLGACMDVLDSPTAQAAEKSLAAGLLYALCADDKTKEAVVKAKASGANGSSCCQVLHANLSNAEAVPRHVVALLAALASSPTTFPVLLKSLAGAIPWGSYISLLSTSHKGVKDHATAIATANYIAYFVSGREVLALEAAAAGLLQALLTCTTSHKSAAAVQAGATCLQATCQAANQLCTTLGELPGAIQKIVDLLGPPPASIISWEQDQLRQQAQYSSPHQLPSAAAASSVTAAGPAVGPASDPQQRTAGQLTQSGTRAPGGNNRHSGSGSNSQQHVRLNDVRTESAKMRTPRTTGNLGAAAGADGADGPPRKLQSGKSTLNRSRSKPIRVADPAEADAAAATQPPAAAGAGGTQAEPGLSPALRSKSVLGHGRAYGSAGSIKASSRPSQFPLVRDPPLSTNSTALKWEGPVPEATRAAVAGLLAELVQIPSLREAASSRLAVPRLATLLLAVMQKLDSAGQKGGKSASKKGSKLAIPPESLALLTSVCVCLEFLVSGDNADCFRVAAAGCLPTLVQLASESKQLRLRRAAKAVVCQVSLLSEVQQQVREAEVPEELLAFPEGSRVLTRLKCPEIRQLLLEFPTGSGLHCLDEVTARARQCLDLPDVESLSCSG